MSKSVMLLLFSIKIEGKILHVGIIFFICYLGSQGQSDLDMYNVVFNSSGIVN
jgi:hypothetical protein